MKTVAHKIKKIGKHILTPIRRFLSDSRAVGIILISCTLLSILLANLPSTSTAYLAFWQQETHIASGLHLPHNTLAWINDVLMTIFFFLVGMEIKRELTIGELASVRKSLLPIIAAIGGMVVPAIIFALFNGGTPFSRGWGIPMATDIAFSLGVLSLMGKKVPVQLKIFLAALAIIDDLGAVITIAIFYTSTMQLMYLLYAAGILGGVIVMNRLRVKSPVFYLVPGILIWYCIFNSGVHATIAGVAMAFAMPLASLEKLEHLLYKPVNFFIMPLFALANTAVALPGNFVDSFSSTISFGIIAGLVAGKPLGIFLFSFIATRLKVAALPSHTGYSHLLGVGILGGIGFTMSIFTATLAYSQGAPQVISKVSVIAASAIAALAGFIYFYRLHLKPVAVSKVPVKQSDKKVSEKEKSYEQSMEPSY